ncbi:hypothetical protein N7494_008614 [Penicillium frequentans]|uniref:Apple domain-containing protein n=1 Tax=Penicillium frequentans TaxID=3151616 RepID=A0AAD6CN83_9EURO|nr:hypothetical protein N7494_008614 [Penicillium glabrum]
MIFKLSTLAIVFVAGAAASTPPQSSSSTCTESILHNTIALFSHGPLTYSYGVTSASACAVRCAELSACQAWLYSTSGEECQLYRQQPVSHWSNPLFVSGFCEEPAKAVSSAMFPFTYFFTTPIPITGQGYTHRPTTSTGVVKRNTTPQSRHSHSRYDSRHP